MPHYLAGQYLGAFTAACLVFLVYWDALVWYEHQQGSYRVTPDTAAIFSSYPAVHLSRWGSHHCTTTALYRQAGGSGGPAGRYRNPLSCLLLHPPRQVRTVGLYCTVLPDNQHKAEALILSK